MMKSNLKKVVAATLAMSMCVPAFAFAADNSGSFETSFDVYSPALNISVPLKLDVEVNPMADNTATGVKQFTVASNSIDIINASVDTDADAAIPVNVTVKADIKSKKDDVITEYKTFTGDDTSVKKKIQLNLSEATTAATTDNTNAATGTGDSSKLLDLSSITIDDAAIYTSPTNTTPVTKYGSLLSINIAGPSKGSASSFITDASKVVPTVGSFAITGSANTNAAWKADDIAIAVTYSVKASKPLTIVTPTVAAIAHTTGASATDIEITVPNVGESKVVSMAMHNDGEQGFYGDFVWDSERYTVEYAPNATTTTQTDATITIKKDDDAITFVTADEYNGKAQDLIIGLSDGRFVVTTLTVTKGN